MFIDNTYTDKYYEIIQLAIERIPLASTRKNAKKLLGYVEKHHIIPKSLGGSDDKTNLVWLTAEEHLEVHMLLIKMVNEKEALRKMYAAAIRMCIPQSKSQQRLFSEDNYQEIRQECAKLHSIYMKDKSIGEKNPFFNKKHTEESKQLISKGGLGLKRSDDTKKNLSLSKLGDKNPSTKVVTCPYCNKTGKSGGMRKHHFEHCKSKDKGA